MKGRRAEHGDPATAWDYRRAIALMQALAIDSSQKRTDALYALAEAWGVAPDYPVQLISDLAKHALEAARKD